MYQAKCTMKQSKEHMFYLETIECSKCDKSLRANQMKLMIENENTTFSNYSES